ncbi:RES family NAD+ phosphorylase [Parasphingopyxis algicola]|uniref:RES family NAD+ phosphorylase n=1 Tax=Parasphingopyxis algicola TaxID=2026624 RepID=UPI0015A4C022|nr:RES family NAD+ phosphorylase [Parasphingopyxis algicola]QLC24848.1 RES family NAD+ phosphorylase [Parasphingopyxis algicola]
MKLPPVTAIRQQDTHRLIPSKYSKSGDSVLTRIADDADHLHAIFDLDHATNDRLLAENNLLPGIGVDELVFGISYYRIVNAAFTHANPLGSRFNSPDRGAWYAGFELETSQAEIAFHKSVELAEIDWFDESVTYDGYLADFGGEFHDIRGPEGFADCLDPESYQASQNLADRLLNDGSAGIVYPGVRRDGGTCLACFRPALMNNVRKSARYRFTWSGEPEPAIEIEKSFID